MHLGHVEVPVRDPQAAKAFYVDVLGFKLVADQGGQFIWVRRGTIELLLRPGKPTPATAHPDAVNFVLYTDAVDTVSNDLAAAGVGLHRESNCWHFQDPDGHWWQLVDPHEDHSGGETERANS